MRPHFLSERWGFLLSQSMNFEIMTENDMPIRISRRDKMVKVM